MEEIQWLVLSMKELLDTLNQPVTMVDHRGHFVYYNRASARMDGVDPANILGRHILDVSPWLKTEDSTLLRCLSQHSRFVDHYQAYHGSDGRQLHYLHSAMPLFGRSGDVIGAIEIGRTVDNQPSDNNDPSPVPDIVGHDARLRLQIDAIDIYGHSELPVLIYGETGTGKELFARRAHAKSPRARAPMLCLNCAAIPENLLESTLFGTTRGAFTGAENKKGLFALADGGTLFLDEINSMPIALQSKLLRVLQDGSFQPLGSQQPLRANVRLIAALNQRPLDAIAAGRLREDLYYRLNVGYIFIPPLRERRGDIALLARRFVDKHAASLNPAITTLSEAAIATLEAQAWPGNVRELENVIRRSLLLDKSGSTLSTIALMQDSASAAVPALPPDTAPAGSGPLKARLAAQECHIITQALAANDNKLAATARDLGLPRTTLISRMARLGLTTP
ncbi:sigma 54-interacting transcriptional regulator [Craterilacuibacter sp. RT1T]|uniref:sigma-54 interaction domain-containing protein n=1 Tax=Craterilacuibacter sp. RT1T TaxID=2942211 RepID=UPI0020BDB351|nr:sigma 54-interacting transcriptional regulator [Craterilacuibacter sp. RT1T]MCL6264636.1 sigma 54-interacting transcriptional regulator [Craterilacuibacter sp. RT1T]